ncbi:MAG TPA: hypothetical protein VN729_06700 [Ktedonobacteraceae bacterium]|nr:hypothetical protein [Ktedonobacteraceae bacterium]
MWDEKINSAGRPELLIFSSHKGSPLNGVNERGKGTFTTKYQRRNKHMLDIDTLNALNDLMARTLYRAEVAHLPKLSQAEEDELAMRARSGEVTARAALIVSCLASVYLMALNFYLIYKPAHDDTLDLAQTASLEMLRALDRALEKRNPGAYLRGIARKELVSSTRICSD